MFPAETGSDFGAIVPRCDEDVNAKCNRNISEGRYASPHRKEMDPNGAAGGRGLDDPETNTGIIPDLFL
jgi:hypothetical protein